MLIGTVAGGDRISKGDDGGWKIDETPRRLPDPSPLRLFLQSCRICELAGNALRGGPLEVLAQNLGLAGTIVKREMNTLYMNAHRLCAGCT